MKKPKCPFCKTDIFVVPEAWGAKVGTVLGGSLGLSLAVSRGISMGALIASTATTAFTPPIRILGSSGGAVAGGIAGAVSLILGCSTMGRQIGLEVDEYLLRVFRCNSCGTLIKA
ncbi:hypothetical protein C4J81_15955 [Deltaproteobacteria bacterium Smac51]|nr:hypothetical protein C4J81_15955 [Deltaproteobacteria bacterium Smac51]